MSKYLAIAGVALAAIAGVLGWLLLDAHEALGKAELKAKLNAETVKVLQAQEARNQAIDAKLEQLAQQRSEHTKEVIREVYHAPATTVCRDSPAMRALDGKLQWRPGNPGGGPAAAPTPAQPVPTTGR